MERCVIAILVSNQSGVLTRVSSMFTRRGFNIDSLTVGETEDPNYSRITVTAPSDDRIRLQIIKQLKKLEDVIEVQIMPDHESVKRELALIKIRNKTNTRGEIMNAVNIFRGKIIDFSPNTLCIEITGETSKINAFLTVVEPYGILEICRTGVVALQRGCHYLNSEIHTIEEE